ncbi:class I SAM-dependent methyltransferase [Gilvibacter sp.]|uniref:class I SAM-dependent methyltransferase n=1 Tax=Gilvibacter sp. TaxID=2729997 RepID=UPI0025C59220|nr:class I SAM-dependent methyltransferase [Gilvibacter sp.]NQX77909.1 class I SAM-dependent methyltransferase [Gilvibacter sp.]
MLSAEEKRLYRSELFRHLDGIVTAPVAYSLFQKGVLTQLLELQNTTLDTLNAQVGGNEGYMNVALRVLASQGWISYALDPADESISIKCNDQSAYAFEAFSRYADVVDFLQTAEEFHPRSFDLETIAALNRIFKRYEKGDYDGNGKTALEQEIDQQIKLHIEGLLVGPITVMLGMDGMFHKYFMEASFGADEFHEDPENFSKILDFLTHIGWFSKQNGHYKFTNKGLFFARRSTAYGVTVSYLPTFRRMDDLLFGNAALLRSDMPNTPEIHVNREMNVWGSGGAHSAYFKKIDEIIIELFNKPIAQQPKGILDMGCGNGAFLIHLFDVIEQRTRRGQMLEEYPLFLVGVDFNKAALKVTRANLIKADIWAKVIWGDIADPETLEKDIQASYDIELADLLNVRTFLDHNRPWSIPKQEPEHQSSSTGAYAHRGEKLSNAAVEQNLYEHMADWLPYIEKFGLLVIELHTLDPKITAKNIGKPAATAYDATHGFSDQFIVELDVFTKVIERLGLQSDPKYFSKYPNNELATVSINYLTKNGSD